MYGVPKKYNPTPTRKTKVIPIPVRHETANNQVFQTEPEIEDHISEVHPNNVTTDFSRLLNIT